MRPILCAFALLAAGPASAQVLLIETTPDGAEVWVDGQLAGPSPCVLRVAPGVHRAVAHAEGYDPAEADATVADGDTARISLRLTPTPGAVRLVGLPDGATTETPGWTVTGEVSRVAPGLTTIRVRVPGHPVLTARVPVEPGAETLVEYAEAYGTDGFAANLLVPGASQLVRGRPLAGTGYLLSTLAAVSVTVAASLRVADADAALREAADAYRRAGSEAEVDAAYVRIDAAHERGRSARRLRTGAGVAVTAVYLASLLDAALHYGRQPELRVGPPDASPQWSVVTTDSGVGARLSF